MLRSLVGSEMCIRDRCKLITEQEKELHNLQMKLSHKKAKAEQIKSEIASLPTSTNVSKSSTLKRRLSNPSHKGLNGRAKSVRLSETFNKCQDIHGGTKENQDPTTWGMIDTLNSKCKADVLAVKLLNSKTSLKRAITNRCLQQDNNQFKNSKENLFRSLSIYYAHSVMGKRKYNNVRKSNAIKDGNLFSDTSFYS